MVDTQWQQVNSMGGYDEVTIPYPYVIDLKKKKRKVNNIQRGGTIVIPNVTLGDKGWD